MRYPFFLRSRQDNVVDSMCRCGHHHTDHDSIFEKNGGTTIREYMEGKCCVDGCACRRFQWDRWVLQKEEAACSESMRPLGSDSATATS